MTKWKVAALWIVAVCTFVAVLFGATRLRAYDERIRDRDESVQWIASLACRPYDLWGVKSIRGDQSSREVACRTDKPDVLSLKTVKVEW